MERFDTVNRAQRNADTSQSSAQSDRTESEPTRKAAQKNQTEHEPANGLTYKFWLFVEEGCTLLSDGARSQHQICLICCVVLTLPTSDSEQQAQMPQ